MLAQINKKTVLQKEHLFVNQACLKGISDITLLFVQWKVSSFLAAGFKFLFVSVQLASSKEKSTFGKKGILTSLQCWIS